MTNARDKANIPVLNFQSKGIDDNADATAITIDSSERIGIGTTSPTSKLSIEASSPDIMFTDTSGGTDSKKWRVYGLDDNFNIGCRNDANNSGQTGYTILRTGATISNHRFSTNGSERMRIENNGLVRIKNTSHTNSLISGNHNLVIGDESSGASGLAILAPTNDNSYVSFFDSGNSGSFRGSINYNHNTDSFRFYVSGSERMRLFSGGNVSIGTTSDPTKLAVSNGSSGVSPHNLGDELFIENNGDTGFTIGSSTSGTGNIFFGDSGDPNRGRIRYHHNGDYMEFGTAGANEKLVIDSSGSIGINTSSPQAKMHIVKTDVGALNDANSNTLMIEHTNAGISIGSATTGEGHIYFSDSGDADVGAMSYFHSDNSLRFRANASERMRLNSTGLGIGTTSPDAELHVGDGSGSSDNTRIRIVGGTSGHSTIQLGDSASANIGQIQYDHANNKLDFRVNSGTRATIDSSGNTHFSRTSESGVGISLRSDGIIKNEVNGNVCLSLFRTNSAGNIVAFYKDTTLTGLIGSVDGNSLVIGEGNAGIRFYGGGSVVVPRTASGGVSDNNLKFGFTSNRWHTFYAGTGSINTSDENEKQSIQSLTTAEMNVAKKLSSLIKTYKWNSSVEEKGDNARTHTGLIAQQVKQAFDDESLDASKYGFWCSDTWYVDADGEEVTEDTEGAISKTRLGLRYSELFAFIQAYNDQRFTELEARITTLEANNP